MPPKSRALEAQRRRRVQREMRRILRMAAQGASSSDDDALNPPPPMVPAEVMVQNSDTAPRSHSSSPPSNSDMDIEEHEARYQPRASPIKKLRRQAERRMRGRRLLYGPQRGDVLSDDTSVNNESFSDNVYISAHSEGEDTDMETDQSFHEIPISSSDPLESVSGSDNEGDYGGLTLRERLALHVTKHAVSVQATAELLQLFKSTGVHARAPQRQTCPFKNTTQTHGYCRQVWWTVYVPWTRNRIGIFLTE